MYKKRVGETREDNLDETKKNNFVNNMVTEIKHIYENCRKRADKEKVDLPIKIH